MLNDNLFIVKKYFYIFQFRLNIKISITLNKILRLKLE